LVVTEAKLTNSYATFDAIDVLQLVETEIKKLNICEIAETIDIL